MTSFADELRTYGADITCEAAEAIERLTAERDNALTMIRIAYDAGYHQAESGLPNHGDIDRAATEALNKRIGAAVAAAYERAATVGVEKGVAAYQLDNGKKEVPCDYFIAQTIRALDPDASAALAEMLDGETRACIATVRKRIDDYVRECGSYDPSTGVTEFPGNGEEWISDMEEIEDDLTARIDQRKEAGK